MNLKSLSLTELAKLRRNVLAELKARRPKSVKPKVRKVKSAEERERERLYAEFREVHTSCWLCGAKEGDRPKWWHGVWLPNERMHIVNQPRVEDVRAILSACSLCHRIQHGDRFPLFPRRPLSVAALIVAKLAHDPDNYDPEFLQKHSVRKLVFPTPAPQPKEPR